MPQTKPTLPELLQKASHWEVRNPGTFEVFTSIWSGREFLTYLVSDNELAELHPHLPIAMRAMAEELATATTPGILSGRSVEQNLFILKNEPVRFKDIKGNLQEVMDLTDLRYVIGRNNMVVVTATTLSMGITYVDDIEVFFIYHSTSKEHRVHTEELDERYPGWQERWELGLDLELPMAVWLPNVLSASPATLTFPLPAITFGDD